MLHFFSIGPLLNLSSLKDGGLNVVPTAFPTEGADPVTVSDLSIMTRREETSAAYGDLGKTFLTPLQETSAGVAEVQQGNPRHSQSIQSHPSTACRSRIITANMKTDILETACTAQLEDLESNAISSPSWSKFAPLAPLGSESPGNPRSLSMLQKQTAIPRSHDRLAVARARLISKLRNRWHPYSTHNCKRKHAVGWGETRIQVPRKDKPKSRAVQVRKPSSGQSIIPSGGIESKESSANQEDKLPSSRPTKRRSGEIRSMDSITLVDLPELIGQVVHVEEEPATGIESSEPDDVGICQDNITTCLLSQESMALGAGKRVDFSMCHL